MSLRLAEGERARHGARRTGRRTVQMIGRTLRTLWALLPTRRRAASVPILGDRPDKPLVVKL